MIANYHTHTRWCRHATGEIEDYIQEAVRKGLRAVAITEHVPHSQNFDPRRMQWEEFPAYNAELDRLKQAAEFAHSAGLRVNAGHGIDYENIAGILTVPHLCELNIGHSIVGRAIMVGMERAVGEMLTLMKAYRLGNQQA